ncbi:MAG: PIN domain-containing protein [Anaerolineae bacterium]|nr:PIN domain-containing protein [Anaerolineae bacterium]
MTAYLLDVNVLIALMDPMHAHHEIAHRWFASRGHMAWATCPITENGFVRILGHPNYPDGPGGIAAAYELLRVACSHSGHRFWADELSILDVLTPTALATHAVITDIYLLALAVHFRGKLASLDTRIPVDLVRGGRAALELIVR